MMRADSDGSDARERIAMPKADRDHAVALASSCHPVSLIVMPNVSNRLTPKQFQCLTLVAEGMTSKEIARSLGLSARTVDDHVEKARIKLDAPTRQRAAAIFRAQRAVEEVVAAPESAPYQIRCEPQAVDEPAIAGPTIASTQRLNDSGIVALEHFPAAVTSPPASLPSKALHHPPSSTLAIIMQILAIAAAIALIVLAYPQLVQGAEAISAFILKTTATNRGTGVPR
jgi:DNA-binding CsgD family transcriptional regulator